MANTYDIIASATVGAGGSSTIDFTSIPQTYTDLVIKICSRTNENSVYGSVYITLNGSTANFSGRALEGTGTAAATFTFTNNELGPGAGATATAGIYGSIDVYIPNYAGTSNTKNLYSDCNGENNASSIIQKLLSSRWNVTSAITSITLAANTGNTFNQYSTATLYGIKNS